MKKWVAVKFNNLETKLKEKIQAKNYKLQRIQLPPNVSIQLEIELEDDLYKRIAANPTFVQRLQSSALKQTDTALTEVATFIIAQDVKASGFNQKVAATFGRDVTQMVNQKLTAAGNAMAREAEKMFEDLKRTQKDLTRFRVKAGCKIGLSAIGIGASIAISVGTAGAVSPLGALAIARSGVTIAQEIAKLALNCNAVDKLIKADFAILKKIMSPDLTGKSVGAKAGQGLKEVGLNVLAKTTGLETTSLKNLKGRIDLLHVNVGKLDKESAKLSEKVYGIMDANKALENTVKAARRNSPATQVGKLDMKLKAAELELHKLLTNLVKVNEGINKANEAHPKYLDAYNAMSSGIPGWVARVDMVVGIATDLCTGIADASTALERGLGSMVTVVTGIADEFALDPIANRAVPST